MVYDMHYIMITTPLPPPTPPPPPAHYNGCICNNNNIRWEAFFGSAMDAADDFSDTMSQSSLRSRRSIRSRRPPALMEGEKSPSSLAASVPPRAFAATATPSVGRRGGVRGGGGGGGGAGGMPMARIAGLGNGDDGMSDVSRDVGGLELEEGWDEKFVYKVGREGRGVGGVGG